MAWLTSLLKRSAPEEVQELPELPQDLGPSGPSLALLVPDVTGISSFRLRLFPTTEAAGEHLMTLHAEARRGAHAFWALHEKPLVPDGAHLEALVLIRASQDSDIVYVVSFLDLESAQSFARFETRRGLELSQLIIYWAPFTQIREELNSVTILPTAPPPTVADVSAAAIAPPVQPRREPRIATTAEAEAEETAQRFMRDWADDEPTAEFDAPTAEDSIAVAEPPAVVEPPAVPEPPAVVEPSVQAIPSHVAAVPPLDSSEELAAVQTFAGDEESEPVMAALPIETVAGDEETTADDRVIVFTHELTDGATVEVEDTTAPPVIEIPVRSYPGDEEAAKDAEPSARPDAPSEDDPAAGIPETEPFDKFDIAYEVERLLRNRRWKDREGEEPFGGFRSPPGRF